MQEIIRFIQGFNADCYAHNKGLAYPSGVWLLWIFKYSGPKIVYPRREPSFMYIFKLLLFTNGNLTVRSSLGCFTSLFFTK